MSAPYNGAHKLLLSGEAFRFGEAKESSASGIQQQLDHHGGRVQQSPENTHSIKAACGHRGIIIPGRYELTVARG